VKIAWWISPIPISKVGVSVVDYDAY